MEYEYQLTKVIQHKTGETRVYRPILPEEERKRREKNFIEAAARFLINVEREKEQKRKEHDDEEQREHCAADGHAKGSGESLCGSVRDACSG